MRAVPLLLTLACGGPTPDPWDPGSPPFEPASLASPELAPPGQTLTLDVSPIVAGRAATWTVTGLNPGELVYIGRSIAGTGAGPCLPTFGGLCLDLLPSVVLHAAARADGSGAATFTANVPTQVPSGVSVAFQAAARRGPGGADSTKSAAVTRQVGVPVDTGGASGLITRPPNPTCLAAARPATGFNLSLTRVYSTATLNLPTILAQPPGDDSQWYAGELGGVIKRFPNTASPTATTVLDIHARVVSGNELGLLGMTFDPDFATNGYLYVSYTGGSFGSPVSRVSRFRSTNGGQTFDPASEVILFSVAQPFSNHNGGNIQFGRDGYLYLGLGDGGSANDPGNRAQNLNVVLGKMLRVDPQGNSYVIPPDNPFAGGGGAPEVWAWGLRNPWRWSFDRLTGTLWAGDVGQDAWEEVSIVERGGNYGWKRMEGTHCANPPGCDAPEFIPPVYEYPHAGGSASIIGGYVYRGSAIPSLYGTYLFGEFYTGEVFALTLDGNGRGTAEVVAQRAGMQGSTFAEDQQGELYIADYAGRIFKITEASPPVGPVFPQRLSETGCFDPNDPTQPAPGLIPYAPRVELWSDGLAKRRWMALPDGMTIGVDPASGDWSFPIGTVLAKEFSWGGHPVETRLFMRHADGGWGAYTYVWDPGGADATLVTAGTELDLGGGKTWQVPSQGRCFSCHTSAAGTTLGLETAQLNGDLDYGGTLANQIDTLDAIGMFAVSPGGPRNLPALPSLTGADPAEARSRAYLHANCSFCHRPGGGGLGGLDLRYGTAFGATG
ncbi:MAG TPA: PQQ-dependent sugar dehydrogenase, partial [Myxococcota bacterium]|nr:PQQ-dependent sugar dehydrogenase [Myxococcota bacterium]